MITKIFFAINIALVLSISIVRAQSTNKFVLKAVVTNQTTKQPLQGAIVKISTQKNATVLTDSSGAFTFSLPAETYTIIISHVGFTQKKLTINLNQDIALSLTLTASLNELQEVTVTANSNKGRVLSSQVGVEIIDRKTALTIPAILGEVDIIKVLQLKPGVKNSGEGTSGISVRGGGTDQNLFLLDGSVVYNPSHLFGFFSTFNIDAIKDVQLYKAGFPAEFSGRLSSVVDVNTLKGTDSAFSVGGGIGLIASRLNLQGNLLHKNKQGKKLTYNLAARRTYADVFTSAINNANKNDSGFNPIPTYFFYDMNGRVDFVASDKNQFYASFYHGKDFFIFDSDVFGSTFSWGNTAASLHWKHLFNSKISIENSLHLSDYNYSLNSQFDRFDFKLGSGVKEYSFSQKYLYTPSARHKISFGLQGVYNQFKISTFNINSEQATETFSKGENLNSLEAGIYIADDWDVTKKLRVNIGTRFTVFTNGKTYSGVEPRASVRYLLTDNFSVKASYARMQQYKHLVASSGASLPTDIWYPSTEKIKPEISDQASLGFTWNINNKFLITTEGYYKWMRQLVDYKPGASLLVNENLENEFVFGKGKSYGSEISFEKTAGKLKGWVGYTLAWTTRQFEAINNGKMFFPRFDRRHELSVVASYPLAKRLTFSGSWTYYTGNAVSLPTGRTIGIDAPGTLDNNTFFNLSPVYPERGNFRMPDYHRLDVGIILKLRPKHGSTDLTFSAYNAYSRLNAYFISFEAKNNSNGIAGTPGGYEPKAITLFPIIPSITYNFKF